MAAFLSFQEMLEDSNEFRFKIYKWALVGTEFRFIQLIFQENHRMLVMDGEDATDAGTIMLNKVFWRITDLGSTTLQIGCSASADTALETKLADAGRELQQR